MSDPSGAPAADRSATTISHPGPVRDQHPTAPEAVIRTLVIIPAFNEVASLPAVLERLAVVRPGDDVVVVSDGSTDGTAEVARKAGATVLELPFNLGIGGALRTGFRYAVDHGYDRAAQLDADGQHDPAALQVLFDGLADADLVIGSRFLEAGDYEVGSTRLRAMRLLQGLIRLLTGRRFTDTSSGFRAFSAPMLRHFATRYSSEYMESVEALLDAIYAGYRVQEVPVHMHERQAGEASNFGIKLAYHYLRLVVTLLTHAGRRPGPATGGAA